MTRRTDEILNRIATAIETERNFRTGEVRELQRVAEAIEEILRLVKKDMERKWKLAQCLKNFTIGWTSVLSCGSETALRRTMSFMHSQRQMRKMKIRSKHNNLLNYFVHDKRDLSPAYRKSCEKFLKEISLKLQASSSKRQASSTKKNLTKVWYMII